MGEELNFSKYKFCISCDDKEVSFEFKNLDRGIFENAKELQRNSDILMPTKEISIELKGKVTDELIDVLAPPLEYDDIENRGIYVDLIGNQCTIRVKFINIPEEYLKFCGSEFFNVISKIVNNVFKGIVDLSKPIDFEKELNRI